MKRRESAEAESAVIWAQSGCAYSIGVSPCVRHRQGRAIFAVFRVDADRCFPPSVPVPPLRPFGYQDDIHRSIFQLPPRLGLDLGRSSLSMDASPLPRYFPPSTSPSRTRSSSNQSSQFCTTRFPSPLPFPFTFQRGPPPATRLTR